MKFLVPFLIFWNVLITTETDIVSRHLIKLRKLKYTALVVLCFVTIKIEARNHNEDMKCLTAADLLILFGHVDDRTSKYFNSSQVYQGN